MGHLWPIFNDKNELLVINKRVIKAPIIGVLGI